MPENPFDGWEHQCFGMYFLNVFPDENRYCALGWLYYHGKGICIDAVQRVFSRLNDPSLIDLIEMNDNLRLTPQQFRDLYEKATKMEPVK